MPLTVCHPLAAMLLGIFAVDAEESVPGIVYVSAVKAAPFPSVVAEGEEGRPRYGGMAAASSAAAPPGAVELRLPVFISCWPRCKR